MTLSFNACARALVHDRARVSYSPECRRPFISLSVFSLITWYVGFVGFAFAQQRHVQAHVVGAASAPSNSTYLIQVLLPSGYRWRGRWSINSWMEAIYLSL